MKNVLENGWFGVIKYDNEYDYFVVVDNDLIFQKGEYEPIKTFNEYGKSIYSHYNAEIVAVYKSAVSFDNCKSRFNKGEKGIDFKKAKRLTVAEIENLLGYPVEIVSE